MSMDPKIEIYINNELIGDASSMMAITRDKTHPKSYHLMKVGRFESYENLDTMLGAVPNLIGTEIVDTYMQEIYDEAKEKLNNSYTVEEFKKFMSKHNIFDMLEFYIDNYLEDLKENLLKEAFLELCERNIKTKLFELSKEEMKSLLAAFDIYLPNVVDIDLEGFIKEIRSDNNEED